MKKILLTIPLIIVLVLSLTLTSFGATSAPLEPDVSDNTYIPCQAPLQYAFRVNGYSDDDVLTDYELFMDIGSPVVDSGTTYSNIKLWNNSLNINYSFRTVASVGDGVTGITISKGTEDRRLVTMYPRFNASGKYFVYDPDLKQGFYKVPAIGFGTVDPSNAIIHQYASYIGTILYPTVDGSFVPAKFQLFSELDTGAVQTVYSFVHKEAGDSTLPHIDKTYPVASSYGCSLVPSRLSSTGNADKLSALEVFTIAYNTYHGDETLYSPSVLADSNCPVVFSSYELTYKIEGYSIRRHTGSEPGRDYIWPSWDGGEIFINNFNITIPSTVGGVPRTNETLNEFIDIIFPLEDIDSPFEFVSFISTILVGVLSVELFPGFYLYSALSVVVAISLIIWLLKVFAGG